MHVCMQMHVHIIPYMLFNVASQKYHMRMFYVKLVFICFDQKITTITIEINCSFSP